MLIVANNSDALLWLSTGRMNRAGGLRYGPREADIGDAGGNR